MFTVCSCHLFTTTRKITVFFKLTGLQQPAAVGILMAHDQEQRPCWQTSWPPGEPAPPAVTKQNKKQQRTIRVFDLPHFYLLNPPRLKFILPVLPLTFPIYAATRASIRLSSAPWRLA